MQPFHMQYRIVATRDEQAPGGEPVSPGSPGLLHVRFERPRHAEMGNQANTGMVDAHAECTSCHDYSMRRADKVGLNKRPATVGQAGMVRLGRVAGTAQGGRDSDRESSCRNVDQGGSVAPKSYRSSDLVQRRPGAGGTNDFPAQVRTINGLDDSYGVTKLQLTLDIDPCRWCRSRRERDNRGPTHRFREGPDRPVVRPKIVPPFGDAVRLVHDDARQAGMRHQLTE